MRNELLSELKKSLEKIYSNIRERIEPKAWQQVISSAYAKSPEETSVAVIDFLCTHEYMPASTFRAACHAIDLRNNPAMISDIYSEKLVYHLFEKMVKKEPLRYDYIALGTQESEIREIVDLAEKTNEYIEKGQIYLAGKGMERLRKFSPTHPDILEMQKRYLEVRITGGAAAKDFQPEDPLKKYEQADYTIELDEFEDNDAAIAYCEKIIEEDYRNFYAYYPLGKLYLEAGDEVKAEYIADLLLDFDQERTDACQLKAMILEKKGKTEDASFYRRKALLEINENKPVKTSTVISGERIQQVIVAIADNCDELIRKGRTTEAYYELLKRSAEHPSSTVLKFKKGFILYLMKREPEARTIMKEIAESSPVYKNAVYLIEDIDFNIVDNNRFDEIPLSTTAEIMFNTGNYEKALEIYRKVPEIDMSGRAWSIRGRCEVYAGFINSALNSFQNALASGDKSLNVREITGMLYLVKGDPDMALQLYDEAIAKYENVENVCSAKASLLYDMGKKDELLNFRRESESILGHGSDVDGYAGLITMEDEDSYSRDYLKKAVESGSQRSVFYLAAAEQCIVAEDYANALQCIEKGISYAEDGEEELYVKKLRILYLSGKYESAKAAAARLIEKYPENAEVCYLLGMVYAELGEDTDSVVWLAFAVEKNPNSHTYTYALADRCYETSDFETALKYYTVAIGIDSTDYISFKRRAVIYAQRDEDQKALSDLDCAMLLKPDDPEIYVIIGNILKGYEFEETADVAESEMKAASEKAAEVEAESQLKDGSVTVDEKSDDSQQDTEQISENSENTRPAIMDDAERDSEYYYTKAITLDPDYRQGYICRAKYYAENKRLEEALADIENAIKIDAEDVNSYMVRGIILHFSGKNDDAIKDFLRATESEETAVQAYSYISKCCNSLENYDDAVSYAEKGLEKNPDFLNLNVNRGVAFYRSGKYNQAIEDFKKVISKKNTVNTVATCSAYMFRGMCFDRLDQKEDAVADYRMSLKYNPDNSDVKKRMEELEQQIEAAKPKQKFTWRKIFGK